VGFIKWLFLSVLLLGPFLYFYIVQMPSDDLGLVLKILFAQILLIFHQGNYYQRNESFYLYLL
jgi:hypothetical protein